MSLVQPSALGSLITLERGTVIRFECEERRIRKPGARHHNDVETWPALVETEDLTGQTLRAVAAGCSAKSSRGDHTQPAHIQVVRQDEQRQIPPTRADATLLCLEELRPPPKALSAGQGSVHWM